MLFTNPRARIRIHTNRDPVSYNRQNWIGSKTVSGSRDIRLPILSKCMTFEQLTNTYVGSGSMTFLQPYSSYIFYFDSVQIYWEKYIILVRITYHKNSKLCFPINICYGVLLRHSKQYCCTQKWSYDTLFEANVKWSSSNVLSSNLRG